VTLRAYVDLLRFEDEAYGQDYFCEAAAGMVRIYLHLMDHPMSENDAEPDYSSMTAAERKKAKAIARKKKKAAEKKEEAAVAASADAAHGNTNGTSNHNSPSNKPKGGAAGGAGKPSFVEQDPLGKELLGKDPTDEARKYSALLAQHAPSRLQSWLLSYDVSIRRGKALLALRALLHARSLDPGSGEVLYRTVDYSLRVPALLDEGGGLGDAARRIISEESICLLNDRSLEAFVGDAVELVRSSADPATLSLSYRVCVARAAVLSKLWSIKEACGLVTDGGLSDRGVNVESCREALVAMRSFGDEAQPAADEWIRQVQGRFPLLSDFS
jgi:peptide alpha-N-acetyltransferase